MPFHCKIISFASCLKASSQFQCPSKSLLQDLFLCLLFLSFTEICLYFFYLTCFGYIVLFIHETWVSVSWNFQPLSLKILLASFLSFYGSKYMCFIRLHCVPYVFAFSSVLFTYVFLLQPRLFLLTNYFTRHYFNHICNFVQPVANPLCWDNQLQIIAFLTQEFPFASFPLDNSSLMKFFCYLCSNLKLKHLDLSMFCCYCWFFCSFIFLFLINFLIECYTVHETFDAIEEYSLLSDRIDLDLS